MKVSKLAVVITTLVVFCQRRVGRVRRPQVFRSAEGNGREVGWQELQGEALEVTFRMTAGGSA